MDSESKHAKCLFVEGLTDSLGPNIRKSATGAPTSDVPASTLSEHPTSKVPNSNLKSQDSLKSLTKSSTASKAPPSKVQQKKLVATIPLGWESDSDEYQETVGSEREVEDHTSPHDNKLHSRAGASRRGSSKCPIPVNDDDDDDEFQGQF